MIRFFLTRLTLFVSWFDHIRPKIWPRFRPNSNHNLTHNLTHDSILFDFDPVQMVTLPCSFYDSILFDSWFDPFRHRIRPSSSHDLTPFQPAFDHVRISTSFNWLLDSVWLMIRLCSTPSNFLVSWFNHFWLMIRLCSTHDSTLFDLWVDPVGNMIWYFDHIRFMIRAYLTYESASFISRLDTVWPMFRLFLSHDLTLFDTRFEHV